MGDYLIPIVWGLALIASVVTEALTAELVAIWFFPGTLAALILSLADVPLWIQMLIFAVVSAVMLYFGVKLLRKKLVNTIGQEKTDLELLIGKTAVVIERIDNDAMTGAVKIDGKEWSARMSDNCEYAEVGEFVEVEGISGVKLICKWK